MKKMKGLLIVLVLLLGATSMQAQLRFGIRGGVNLANANFRKNALDTKSFVGAKFGPSLEFMMPLLGLGVETGALYTQKGFELYDKNIKTDYIQVPVNFKWRLGVIPFVKPYLAAGPYVDFKVAGNKLRDIPENIDGIKGQIESKSTGFGMNFTAGAEILKAVQVGLTYDMGLSRNYKAIIEDNTLNYSGRGSTWSLAATIYF